MLWMAGAAVAIGAFEMRSFFNSSASQAVFDSITTNNVGQVSRLLLNGTSANVRDAYGDSALLYAANSGRMDIVRLLLKNHADPNLGTPQGISALNRSGMEHGEIVSALLDTGADPNRVDSRRRTLLAYACTSGRYSDLISMLLKHKANPNVTGEYGPPLVSLIESGNETQLSSVKALLAAGANPNATDSASTPILVWCAEQCPSAMVKVLIEAGAKVSATDTLRRTALDAACRQQRDDIVEILLKHGADPNVRDKDGNTAVMYAVSGLMDNPQSADAGCASILKLLSQHGARLDEADSTGRTPSQFAAELGHSEIARLL
jgi:ankyrin repeat protein